MVFVTTEIEVTAPPHIVREIFLDFASYPEWHKGRFKSIEVVEQKDKTVVQPGDKLKIELEEGLKFSPVMLVSE